MAKSTRDDLRNMREQVRKLILARYDTVEQFCWDKDLSKATVSNFLRNRKDFNVSTLSKIAQALGKSLTIKLD